MNNESESTFERNRSQSFVSTNSNGSGGNLTVDSISNKEELKIKDLIIKIQVLRNAVIEERNKNAELEKDMAKLKKTMEEYENILTEKENMIITSSREKYELQSKLDIEKQKSEGNSVTNQFSNLLTGIFNKKEQTPSANESELKKLLNENRDLQIENGILKKKVEDQSLDFEKVKIEYQKMINLQIEKMKSLERTIIDKNKIINENNKKFEIMYENYKKFDIEKTKYESKVSDLMNENKIREDKIVELLYKLEDKENIISSYKESLGRHEIESAELARKLAELKNAILETNMVIQNFKCQKVGALFNADMEITFGRTDDNEYVMILKEGDQEEYVNVEDVEYMKTSERFMDMIDICYLVR
jgi:hypothetical protein